MPTTEPRTQRGEGTRLRIVENAVADVTLDDVRTRWHTGKNLSRSTGITGFHVTALDTRLDLLHDRRSPEPVQG